MTAEPATGRLDFHLDSPAQAEALIAALQPEMGADVPGSVARLERDGTSVAIVLEAEDAGALRAAVNSYLRWARLALDMQRLARP